MSDPILKIRELTKFFSKGELVLDSINLDLRAGESIAIVGRSGSGKSTLLHLIGGLMAYEQGCIYFKEREIRQFSDLERCSFRNRILGFIYQKAYLLRDLTVLDNILLPLKIGAYPLATIKNQIDMLLGKLGLFSLKQRYPSQLSGGEAQRVTIARALVTRPQLILADEPTGNLDQRTSREVLSELLTLTRERKASLIMVTHDLELSKLLDRIYCLENGRLVKSY